LAVRQRLLRRIFISIINGGIAEFKYSDTSRNSTCTIFSEVVPHSTLVVFSQIDVLDDLVNVDDRERGHTELLANFR
jgi:hypothetical protein